MLGHAGGQHQGSNSPVLWPVDFVTAIVVDGKVRAPFVHIQFDNCFSSFDHVL